MSLLLMSVLLLGQTVGKVVAISDGDTIIIRPEQGASVKVRLIGIDAPERGQAFGTRARQELGELVAGQVVEVIGTEKDRYGRLLGDVRHDGRSINLDLIRRGMAWAYVEYDPPPEYVAAEDAARAARRGLWSDKSPIPPWTYRRNRRAGSPVITPEKGADSGAGPYH
jgi:micrococcal nuclease